MSTRDSFEAWYALQDQSEPEPEKAYELFESGREELIKDCLFHGWQAATSRQEAKIKALVDALEGVAAMARCGQLDKFIGEPWLNSVHQALAATKEQA